ncbi:uncharacterized protein [Parasteatoda tepidariorum]|uniref:uncharacterized protein n=1 Tax=Parasteatoda tepidariorum TaxID=114398 RepID=UPI0039BD71FC
MLPTNKLICIFLSTVVYCRAFDLFETARKQLLLSALTTLMKCTLHQYCECELPEEERECLDIFKPHSWDFFSNMVNTSCNVDLPECDPGEKKLDCLKSFLCTDTAKERLTSSNCILETGDIFAYDFATDPESTEDVEKFRACFSPMVSFCLAFPTYCKSDLG